MQRRLTPDEKIKLSTFVKDFRLNHEGGTQKECADLANKECGFDDYTVEQYTVVPFWGAGVTSEYAKKKRAYTKKAKADPDEEDPVILEDAPSLAGLIKKIQELEAYAEKLSGHQKKQLEKLFLV